MFEENDSIERNGEKPIESLLNMTGGLMLGHPDSLVVKGTIASIQTHSLPYQIFSSTELKERYPILTPDDDTIGVFETEAGYLIPEACIETHYRHAEKNGAILHFEESFISWKPLSSTSSASSETIFEFPNSSSSSSSSSTENLENQSELIEITTSLRKYITKKLVLTVGAWAPEIYGSVLPFNFRIERRVLYWIRPSNSEDLETFKVNNFLFPHLISYYFIY